ncbi:MAG TPA: hypothetical protein VFP87_08340 [Chitinophagaceae bacterium]|nr:hypothetical protein [Chitinophagaceae bacterium]
MKKYFAMATALVAVILLSNCHSAKKTAGKTTAKSTMPAVTYHTNMETVIANNCSPCHFPSKGGNKTPFDSYDAAKKNIDSMIVRIEKNPSEKGFMPFKRPKLSDSTITLFKQWRDAGAPQ